MSSIFESFFIVKWTKTLLKGIKVRKRLKQDAYYERQWDKKLRGLK